VFAGVALALAAIGIYGVVAYAVDQRRGEIGIRMALGARAGDVRRLILREGARLYGLGLVLGLLGAWLLTHLLVSLLYGVTPHDPLTMAAVAALLALVATLACLVPAQRATRVDPMVALRTE
jgi:putative ABC transport system permease protein